jgi:IclR family acetate operon transcriptional repressor
LTGKGRRLIVEPRSALPALRSDLFPRQRCFEIVELLAADAAGLPLTGIARALALPKSAAHRLLLLLVERGYVHQDATTQQYRLTFKLATLGFRFLSGTTLPDIAQPVLDRIAQASGDLARLAVVDGDGMRWVAKAQGAQSGLRYDPEMGYEVALNATAVARLWLVTLPEKEAISILDRYAKRTKRAKGPNAPKSMAALVARMRETRRRAYAEAIEEGAPGVAAVAAAIRARRAGCPRRRHGKHRRADQPPDSPARRPMLGRMCIDAARELGALWPVREFQRASVREEVDNDARVA